MVGELVASEDGVPHFPHLTRRLLHGDHSVAVTFVAFDVLQADGHDLMRNRITRAGGCWSRSRSTTGIA